MRSEPEPLRSDALDFVVRLLFELGDAAADSAPFHDRICEAVCGLTTLERAVLFLYDPARRLVVPAGSHGVEPEILAHTYGTLEETPIAQRALAEDRSSSSTSSPARSPSATPSSRESPGSPARRSPPAGAGSA